MRLLISELEKIAEQVSKYEDTHSFLSLLYEFAKLLTDQRLNGVRRIMFEKKASAHKHISILEEKARAELVDRINALIDHLKLTGAHDQQVTILFQHLVDIDRLDLSRKLLPVFEMVSWDLLNDTHVTHKGFFQKFCPVNQINDDIYIRSEDIFPVFHAWENETGIYIIQTQQNADWYGWSQILAFFERFDAQHFDGLRLHLLNTGMNTSRLEAEHNKLLKCIALDEPQLPSFLPSKHMYLSYMRRIIFSIKEAATVQEKFLPTGSFKSFNICGKTVLFGKKTLKCEVLSKFFKKDIHSKKKISVENLHMQLKNKNIAEIMRLEKTEKDVIYNVKSDINSDIKKQIGIDNYLVIEKSMLFINPCYT